MGLQEKYQPDGTIRKCKARFCVRGDKQIKGIDFFDTYTPIVSRPVVHLMLSLSILCDLETQQVDYSSTFAQAKIDDDVYIMLPDGFEAPIDGNNILKLCKTLNGL